MSGRSQQPGAPPPVSPYGYTGDARDEADKAMEQLLRIAAILRRRWLAVTASTVLCIAGALVAIVLLQPRWRAEATVVLHVSGPQVLDKIKGVSDDAEGRLLAYQEYYQTQREIIGSRAVAERALEALGLANDPVFLGIDGISSEAERLARTAEIDPVERMRELTNIGEVRNSRILVVSADYPDRFVAAEMANALADSYLEYVRNARSRTGETARKNLKEERKKSLDALQRAEAELAEFKREHGITSISLADRQNEITQAIIATTQHLKDAESTSHASSAAYKEATRLHKEGSLASTSLLPPDERKLLEDMRNEQLAAEREVEKLSVRYGEKWPDLKQARRRLRLIDARIKREEADLLKSLEARANKADETERKHHASLKREKDKALELTQLERRYRELEREATTAAETYAMVARRDTEIEMSNRVEAGGIEILDYATPPREPVFPPKALLVTIAAALGLGLGALLALVIDVRDHRIRGLADLERAIAGFGLPVLGQLPLLPADARLGVGNIRAQHRQRDLHAYLFPQSVMAERCRGIRTALSFSDGATPLRTLLVTSPKSSEGKSSTAINLAMSFCQSKKRVLLIDADMRRPRLHHVFPPQLEHEGFGLSAVLTGERSIDDALIVGGEDQPENLAILPCGALPPNPAELLESPACRRLLLELRERYDIILLDSPPVLPVTDPLVLARHVDGLVIVARCQSTTRSELQRALTTLRHGETNLLGVILNEVDHRRERSGYYGSEYYAYAPREPQESPSV
ncbi:MAG: polysaccharide biosynthesis tyrosine autokinase [Myxococcales bacterium]|nr:polysaccharide biosynthesis tyrosine autokinase [Myxococcales bacterium]MCB9752201.1 polysaccharide biosynthesis tyrosine autokinase [Myxococcales bacterium]